MTSEVVQWSAGKERIAIPILCRITRYSHQNGFIEGENISVKKEFVFDVGEIPRTQQCGKRSQEFLHGFVENKVWREG